MGYKWAKKTMKKMFLMAFAIASCCVAFAEDPYYCPAGTTARPVTNETEYKYSNSATIRSGNCTTTSTTNEGAQNRYQVNGKVSGNANIITGALKAGAEGNGSFNRDGEKTTTTSTTTQCNETTVRYICK